MGESFKLHSQALVGYEDESCLSPDEEEAIAPMPKLPRVAAY